MKASMANFPSHVEEIGAVAAHFDVLDQIRRFVRRCLLLRLGHGQLQNVLSKDGAVGDGEEEDGRRLESRCVVVVRAEDVDDDEALGRQRRFPVVENLAIGLFAVPNAFQFQQLADGQGFLALVSRLPPTAAARVMAPAGRIPADEETNKEEPTTNRRTRSPGNHRVSSAARLSSSSGLSSSQATTTSSTASDADSGIDGVCPRDSAAAFGESTLSPSQSILYIDSISARNSVFHDTTKAEKQPADDSTNEPEEKSNSTLPADEGSFTDPGTSVLVVEGDPRRDRAHRIPLMFRPSIQQSASSKCIRS